ncbi:MAG TPA: DUF885 domain-containing protein [Candidatus Acidoferrum sp.]|nr:DUF885 domain-containing protein [Candidatus Acidoferrum sp.]
MTDLSERVAAFFDEYMRLDPVSATSIGDHRFDDRWPDLTDAGRSERLEFADRWLAVFQGFDPASVSRDDAADLDVLIAELEASRFRDTDLLEERWDPLAWIYLLGGGVFPLLSREFAPLATRLAATAGRLEGIPAVLDAARSQLVGAGDRPVSRFHVETAIRQLPGIAELADEAVATGEAAAGDPAVAAILERLRTAAATAKAALTDFGTHLSDVVMPASEGEGRLGATLFTAKLHHTLRSDLTADEVLARAETESVAIRAEMVRLARDLWATWVPGTAMWTAASAGSTTAAENNLVRTVLDAIAGQHPAADDLLDASREEVARIEAFCREHDVIGLADEPLEIMWTPVFLQAFGGAMLDSPGPLDKGEKAFFCITPIPEDWTPEQAESRLREDNDRHMRVLTIHEAVPGHYLQGVYSNRCPSLPRTILWSGVFAEGWAVYVTQVMMDLGYGADDPALMLVHWKFYLRGAINAIIDHRIHALGMTEDEAVSLMIDGGFQEESEARNKWNRARLSSTQLSTYFVGSVEFWDIEREARRRAAAASGDPRGAAAVPEPRVVGDFGQTPGFDYRPHLESVISHGSPTMPVLRRLLFPGG